MTGVLAEIVATTRRDLLAKQMTMPVSTLQRRAEGRTPEPGRFLAALSRPGRTNIIAECKRRSPSKGLLRAGYQPASIARVYEEAGAAAISVLTEPQYFDGSLDHLAAVRASTTLPLVRKDFIIDEYQLVEARAAGADAVLLIAAVLGPSDLTRFVAAARRLALEPLVEVHDRDDVASALDAGAAVVGVNNRDLRSFGVDLATSEQLIQRIPRQVTAVAESGLHERADILRLQACGYRAFLIGAHLMTSADPGGALRRLLNHEADDPTSVAAEEAI